ncbi:MAG TPA: DUF2269 family protein [Thermoanaerobaculia bacterium]|nr:DUF2269 family protein [Thermoanaerobaculia bacterium]
MPAWKMFIPWMWTLHLIGAIWLSAGVLAGAVIFAQLKRIDGDLASRAFGLRLAWRLMTVFVVPGALFTGALGFYLLHAFRIGFLPGWVKVSALLYFILLAGILFVQLPGVRRARNAVEAAATAGAPTPELRAVEQAKLPAILTHVNATLIFILIFLMAFKPF